MLGNNFMCYRMSLPNRPVSTFFVGGICDNNFSGNKVFVSPSLSAEPQPITGLAADVDRQLNEKNLDDDLFRLFGAHERAVSETGVGSFLLVGTPGIDLVGARADSYNTLVKRIFKACPYPNVLLMRARKEEIAHSTAGPVFVLTRSLKDSQAIYFNCSDEPWILHQADSQTWLSPALTAEMGEAEAENRLATTIKEAYPESTGWGAEDYPTDRALVFIVSAMPTRRRAAQHVLQRLLSSNASKLPCLVVGAGTMHLV